MIDTECVSFLQWLLPQLQLRWAGFRRVRRQVCKRFQRRFAELGLDGTAAYRRYLRAHPEELSVADFLCRVTISRFNRDRGVFRYLADQVLPTLGAHARASGSGRLTVWSVGCASGEEPYTVALVWHFHLARRLAGIDLQILGTDVDETLLQRASRACYSHGTLRELPRDWLDEAFDPTDGEYRLRAPLRSVATFAAHDVRSGAPDGCFDLVLCRNLAFTYFDAPLQLATAATLRRSLRDGGALVLGQHEQLPGAATGFDVWSGPNRIYRASGGAEGLGPISS